MDRDSDITSFEDLDEIDEEVTKQLGRTLRAAAASQKTSLDYVFKPGELVEAEFEAGSLSASGRKSFGLMLRVAGKEAGEKKTFTITKSELRGTHKSNERIQPVMDELLRVIVRIRTTTKSGKPAVMSQSLLANCVEETSDNGAGVVEFEFSDGFRAVVQRSNYYAKVNITVQLALQSRYSISLYDLGCLVINRYNRVIEIPVEELRRRLGIQEGSFKNFAELRRDVLKKAKGEIDQLADFTFDWEEIRGSGRGRPVITVRLIFAPKESDSLKETARELDRPKIGRKARRDGADEMVLALPSPTYKNQISGPSVFPSDSLHYCSDQRIVTIVADYAQGWDRDNVANAYREKMGDKLETLSGNALYKSWEGFCKAFARQRKNG